MAFPRLNEDLDIVAKMDDEPNDVGGLSADAFKAVFDMAGNIIKVYLNDTLVAELESPYGASNIGIQAIEGVNAGDIQRALEILKGQINDTTAGAIPDGSITTEKLKEESVATSKLAEGAVTTEKIANGAVTDNKIVSVSVNKIDGMVVVSTDNITDFSVTERKLSGGSVTEPKLGVGAVTEPKIAEGAVSKDFTLALTVDGWTGNEPCTQTVSVVGMLDTDEPVVDYTPSADFEVAVAESEAYGLVYDIVTGNGTVTAYAIDKPEIAINLRLKVVRK